LNNAGNVVATTRLSADGAFLFDNPPATTAGQTYRVQLTTNQGVVGQPAPVTALPPSWTNTGERNDLGDGTDGTTDGISAPFPAPAGSINPNKNFGVVQVATLPVDLLNFSGRLINRTANLEWKVANEVNIKSYSIERSLNGANYNAVYSVNSRGLRNEQIYSTVDNLNSVQTKKVYYRLKIEELNGTFRYSNVIVFNLDGLSVKNVFPNPFVDFVRFEVSAVQNTNAVVSLFDANGKAVLRQIEKLVQGGNQVTVNDLTRIPQGNYILEVRTDDQVEIFKVIKK
jgi:hypothetical protein